MSGGRGRKEVVGEGPAGRQALERSLPKAYNASPEAFDLERERILFHRDEMAKPSFDPRDAVDLWDLINRQDRAACERVQRGMGSRAFEVGHYVRMEDLSLDILRYVAEKLGPIQE